MKIFILMTFILLAYISTAKGGEEHSLRFNFKPEDRVYKKILQPLWGKLPERIELGVVPLDQEGSFTAQISRGAIDFNNNGFEPVFSGTASNENNKLNETYIYLAIA